MTDMEMYRTLIEQAHEHILKAQAFIAPLMRMLNAKESTDPEIRLEKIAKDAATISTISSEEAFEIIMKGIIKVPEQLQTMIDTVAAMQGDWPMPAWGWKRFVEDVERTNERFGLDLHVDSDLCLKEIAKEVAAINAFESADTIWALRGMVSANLDDDSKNFDYVPKETEIDLEAIRKRLEEATTGPWRAPFSSYVISSSKPTKICQLKCIHIKNDNAEADSKFISHSHEDIRGLLGMVERLLSNDIPIEQGDGWISVEERMPTEDALYLVYSPSANPKKPFIGKARFNSNNDLGWEFNNIIKTWLADAITHWMPLPWPPKEN